MQILIPFKGGINAPERWENLERCLWQLNNISVSYKVLVPKYTESFNRSKLLNAGISMIHEEDSFFCCDADMLVYQDFFDYMIKSLRHCDMFFPVCLSMREDGSSWFRHTGFGMFGTAKKKWTDFGLKWNEELQRGQDVDLYNKCALKSSRIIREECSGLIHQWHPSDMKYKTQYHEPILTTGI